MSIEGNQNYLYIRNQEGKKLTQKAFKADVSKSSFANNANKDDLGELLRFYDKNHSGKLDADEAQDLWNAMSTIDTNGNRTIDENEAMNYLKGFNEKAGTNISKEVLYEFLQILIDENAQNPPASPVASNNDGAAVIEDGSFIISEEGASAVSKNSDVNTLKTAFGGRNVVSATIDGASTGITNKNYTGQIRLPKGASIEDGKYPKQVRMSLPAGYSGSMVLNLVDEEKGIYETRAHDRQFQITVDDNGNVQVGSVQTEELNAKLQANQAQYVAATAAKAQASKNLKQYKVNGELCQSIGADEFGRTYVQNKEGKVYVISHDGKVLSDDYVEAHRNFAHGNYSTTLTDEKNTMVAKARNGRAFYFNAQTGKALSLSKSKEMVKADATYIAEQMYDAAKGGGTKNEQLGIALSNTYSRAVFQEVNRQLAPKDKDYKRSDATPVEALIMDEANNRAQAREWYNLLLYDTDENGKKTAKGTLSAKENAQMIKREMAHAGKKSKVVAEVNDLFTSRDARVELEAMYEAEAEKSGLQKNDGTYLRAVWAAQGLSDEQIEIADIQLIENGIYDHENDQEHRDLILGRAIFEHPSEEVFNAGLRATDDAIYYVQDDDGTIYSILNEDLVNIYERAEKENSRLGYEQQVDQQDALQTYFAGRMSENGKVNAEKVGRCNTNFYKGDVPYYIQAQQAIYAAESGNAAQTFTSMDPNVYMALNYYIQNGDIDGVSNMQELYQKALNSKGADRTSITANAILSGQIEFSDEEVADFCIKLMHSADNKMASARSSGYNATDANTAENNVEQLKLILQSHPQIHNVVIDKMQKTSFGYSVTTTNGFNQEGQMPTTTTQNVNRNGYWNDIMENMLYQADEAVFFDREGNRYDAEKSEYIASTYNESLADFRNYVADLEREFNLQVMSEGALSSMANNISEFTGLGTDREDVKTQYIKVRTLLNQLEVAAQGKLRDSQGRVVSVDDLLNNCPDLEGTNQSYKSTISAGKTAIMLAPVIATTAIVAAPAAAGGSAAATALGAGATVAKVAGGAASVIASSTAAGLTHYGTGMVELRTSATGNTKAAREQLAADAVNTAEFTALAGSVASASQGIRTGANLIKPLAKFNSTTLGKVASNVVFLGGDIGLYVAGENAIDASKSMNISSEGETIALVNSFAGYGLAKPRGKAKPKANTSINRQPFGVNDADIPASHKIDMSVPKVETPVQKPKRVQHNFQNQQAKNKAVDMAQRIENARSLDELRAIEQECRQLGNKSLIKKLQVRMQESNLPRRTPESPAVSVKPKAQGNVTEFNPVTDKYESVTPEKAKELRKMQQARPELSPNENPATVKREGTIEFEATLSTPKVSMPIASNPIENLSKESDMLKYLKNEKHMLNHDVNVYQMQDGTFIVRSKQNMGFRRGEFFEKFDAQGQKIGNVEANEATALVANQPTIDFENAIKVEVKPLGTSSSMPRQDNFGQLYRPAASGNQPRAQFGGDNPPVQHLTPENPTAGMNIHSDGVPASEPRNPIGFQFGNTAKPSFDRQKADLIEKIDFAIIKFEKSTKPEDINLVKQLKELKHNVSQITDNTGVIQQLNASNNRFAYQVTNNIEDINRLYQEFDDALYMRGDLRPLIDKAEHAAINDVWAAKLAAGDREVGRTYDVFPTEPKPTVNKSTFKPNAEIPIEAVQSEFSKLIDNELYFLKGSARDNYDLLKNMVRKCNDTEALQRALESFKKRSDRNNARILAQQLARI